MDADFLLPVRLKGERTYVQGPDIHDAVCDALEKRGLSGIEKLDLTCHQMVRTSLCARFLGPGETAPDGSPATFRFNHAGSPQTLLLSETGEAIKESVPYAEELLVSAAVFDQDAKAVKLASVPGFSNAEVVVALNKALLSRLFPEVNGKWLFARLQLARSFRLTSFQELQVRFVGHSNFRITRSTLWGDGESLGTLYFSLLPTE